MDNALFCPSLGNSTESLHCCTQNSQQSSLCKQSFAQNAPTFSKGCNGTDCIATCQDISLLYSSEQQDDAFVGNGLGPRQRFRTCANVPSMAGYLSHDLLEPSISSIVEKYISKTTTDDALKNVSRAVTECLTSTCHNARRRNECDRPCSAVNLLINNTTPDLQGINDCLHTLCTGGYDSLPFADADVVGVGVFASYIMQCILVVLLWFGLFAFDASLHVKRTKSVEYTSVERKERKTSQERGHSSPHKSRHQEILEEFLVEFHKAQCYFSATIQIAALSYGIFDRDMLNTFMLIPLATNGVLPVVFAFVLLFRYGRSTLDLTILTTACWTLASVVYWILYSHVIPINQSILSNRRRYRAYQQFMYKLSAIEACGGYSALAVCPNNFILGRDPISNASYNLRVMTPIIWSFSTVCLGTLLVAKTLQWRHRRHNRHLTEQGETEDAHSSQISQFHVYFGPTWIYLLITACFLAGIGMQLSLLSIGTSLNMMDRKHWTFGQIVAVTLWAGPLFGWIYHEVKTIL